LRRKRKRKKRRRRRRRRRKSALRGAESKPRYSFSRWWCSLRLIPFGVVCGALAAELLTAPGHRGIFGHQVKPCHFAVELEQVFHFLRLEGRGGGGEKMVLKGD